MASSGGTAATKAMGKGSTQHQHLVQTEVPTKLLEEWLAMWTKHHQIPYSLCVRLRPNTAGSELLELNLSKTSGEKVANIIFDVIVDRRGRNILSVRDQNTFDMALRKKRLITLNHLFLVHRYKIWSVHYVSPTDDNRYQAQKMKTHGLFSDVHDEVGNVIVADVSAEGVKALHALAPNGGTARGYRWSGAVSCCPARTSQYCPVCISIHDVWLEQRTLLAPLYVKEMVSGVRRLGVALLVAGPGSDLSEVPAAGCEPAALDIRDAPMCPPGPACAARWPGIIWWQAMSDSLRLRHLMASIGVSRRRLCGRSRRGPRCRGGGAGRPP
jgi:hypothetical protein